MHWEGERQGKAGVGGVCGKKQWDGSVTYLTETHGPGVNRMLLLNGKWHE